MTQSGYILRRIAKAFGIQRKTKRLNDIAFEMHLLRDAEAHLGSLVWQHVEPVGRLNKEYWELRKLSIRHDELQQRGAQHRDNLRQMEGERSQRMRSRGSRNPSEMDQQRDQILRDLESLSKERDQVIKEAHKIRKLFDGSTTQLEVVRMEKGEDSPEIAQIMMKRGELKEQYSALKEKSAELKERIRQGDEQLGRFDAEKHNLSEERRMITQEASMDFKNANEELSQLRSEMREIDGKMHELHSKIGRYVCRHVIDDPACAGAIQSQRKLVAVMGALNRSIEFNKKLGA